MIMIKKVGAYFLAMTMLIQGFVPIDTVGTEGYEVVYEAMSDNDATPIDPMTVSENDQESKELEIDISSGEVDAEEITTGEEDEHTEIDVSDNEVAGKADRFGDIEGLELDTDKISDPDEIRQSIYMLGDVKIESVGAQGYDIINGADYISCKMGDFYGLRDGVYKYKDGVEIKVSDDVASNFNVFNNAFVYTTINNEKQCIKVMDANTLELVSNYEMADYDIKHLYVINDEYFYFLSRGDLYSYCISNSEIIKLTSRGDIFSFIPTPTGILYATGSLFDYNIYFGKAKILDSVSDWYTTEFGVVYRNRLGDEKQISMDNIWNATKDFTDKESAYCDVTSSISTMSTAGDERFQTISVDDFYNILAESDKNIGEYAYETGAMDTRGGIGYSAVISNAQAQIANEAKRIYNTKTVAKADIIQWNSLTDIENGKMEKISKGDTIDGILYGQPSAYNTFFKTDEETGKRKEVYPEHGFVFYNAAFDEQDAVRLGWGTQDDDFRKPFLKLMDDLESSLYTDKLSEMCTIERDGDLYYSPRVSLDCSGFVSHCWGLETRHTTYSISTDRNSVLALYDNGNTYKGIQVGDALDLPGSHVVLITAIEYDSNGDIVFIEVTEQTPPYTKQTPYRSLAELRRNPGRYADEGYKLFRVKRNPDVAVKPRLSTTNFSIYETKSFQIGIDSYGSVPHVSVSWESLDEGVATVDKNGWVRGITEGQAIIKATFANGDGSFYEELTCTVTVKPIQISMSPTSKVLYLINGYNSAKLSASASSGDSVSWKSDNKAVADVDQNGNVTAYGLGNATITAFVGKREKTCTISVIEPTMTISNPSMTVNPGATFTLTASATPATNIVWSSSNSNLASVSGGKVTIASNNYGKCTITARANGKSVSCSVTVNPTISLNTSNITKYVGESYTLVATVRPNNSVTWYTSNSNVAVVSNGVVTAKGSGTCTITATANGVSAKATVNVKAKTMTVSPSSMSLYVGKSAKITATTTPSSTITWYSSNTLVATVSGGTVVGKGAGTCTITAMANGISKTCSVTVKEPSIKLNASALNLNKGSAYTLVATVLPSASVTWSTSNSSIATVSNGRVVGIKKGTCVITARANGKSATCRVTVK